MRMFETTFTLEVLAFLTGLSFYKKVKPVPYRLMIFLLFITVINEGLSHYGLYSKYRFNKLMFYNCFFLLQATIIGVVYFSSYSIKRAKFLFYLFVLLVIFGLLMLFRDGIGVLNPDYISAICLAIVILGLYYLYYIYMYGNIINLRIDSMFWFTIGLTIAHFILLFYINAKRIESFRDDKNSLIIFRSLNTVGNIFYYLCIIYSFICGSIFRQRAGT